MRHVTAWLVASIGAWLLGGCTIVTVGEGSRVTSIKPGILAIEPAPGAGMLAYRTRGLGVVPGRSGATLGWASEEAVLLYDRSRCSVVVFDQPKNAEAMAFWRKLAEERPDICLTGEK
ncbi:MAG: hypothetical protein B7Y45_04020 [Sphingomonas sp. 28-66-16]|nr:MAG: hypothetical protein B7Y45_04020 [Sphingomonas sp. 28-66-16]